MTKKNANETLVEKIVQGLLDSEIEDISEAEVKQVAGDLAKRFEFFVQSVDESSPGANDGIFASIYLQDKGCAPVLRVMLPEAEDDGVGENEWRFAKEIDTPAKIAKHLISKGFVWDQKQQKICDADLFKKMTAEMKPSALEQVLAIFEEGQDDDISNKLAKQAIAEGLVKHLSFSVAANDDGEEVTTVAYIYPTTMDDTFKMPYNCVKPLVPQASPEDGCVATEWHFPKGKNSAGQIAKALVDAGFTLDVEGQSTMLGRKEVYAEIKKALAEKSAVDQVMEAVSEHEDAPEDVLAAAVKDGLAKRFTFHVTKSETFDDDGAYMASIFPVGKDATFRVERDVVRAMVPGVTVLDSCMQDEWHFPAGKNKPAQIAKQLAGLGMVWDKKMQKEMNAEDGLYATVQAAVEGGKAKQGFKKASTKKKPAKPMIAPKKKGLKK